MKRLLMTGAAGNLGKAMRTRIGNLADALRLSDIAPASDLTDTEEFVACDLADASAVDALVRDCDGIVHFGGRSVEDDWQTIRSANIDGCFNIYEAARRHGIGRIFLASSNHVTGFYRPGKRLDGNTAPRPDSLYGLSKAFGEDLARLYWDKFGIESVCARIGSSFPRPTNHRMLSTWLSHDDLGRLIERTFAAKRVGWTVVYGASANQAGWWDNTPAAHLGWAPQDTAETYRAEVEAAGNPPGPEAPESRWQGATFAAQSIIER